MGCDKLCLNQVNQQINALRREITNIEAGSVQFEPGNTLFVAKSWAADSDPNVFFTDITSALTRAAVLNPTFSSPVNILIGPGYYNEAVSVTIGYVYLKTLGAANFGFDTVLNGGLTFLIPANTSGGASGIRSTGATSISGSGIEVFFKNCDLASGSPGVTVSGTAFVGVDSSIVGLATVSAGSTFEATGTWITSGASASGAGALLLLSDCVMGDTVVLTTGAKLKGADGGPSVGCRYTTITVDNSAGTTADIRGSTYATLTSAGANGQIDRSYDEAAFSSANSTGTTITFASLGIAPYITAPSSLGFNQISGTAGVPLFPTLAATGFTQTDTTIRVGRLSIFLK